jgi:hypothetical protein
METYKLRAIALWLLRTSLDSNGLSLSKLSDESESNDIIRNLFSSIVAMSIGSYAPSLITDFTG